MIQFTVFLELVHFEAIFFWEVISEKNLMMIFFENIEKGFE